MKLCYVHEEGRSATGASALWARAFAGDTRTPDALEDLSRSCRADGSWPYDVVLFEVTPESRATPQQLRRILRSHRSCTLALHVARSPVGDSREHALWRDALAAADVVLTSQRAVSRALRKAYGVIAYDVAPPLPEAIERDMRRAPDARGLTVAIEGPYGHPQLRAEIGLLAYAWTRFRHRVTFVSPRDRDGLAAAVRRSAVVYLPRPIEDGGDLAALCAASGAVLVAHRGYDPAKRPFPFTTFTEAEGRRRRRLLFLWLHSSPAFSEFFRAYARRVAVEDRSANARVEFARKVQYARPDVGPAFEPGSSQAWIDRIHHRQGPVDIDGGGDDCVVFCLVRNGAHHLPSFLRHYRGIGIRHFVFVDNGSDDRTIDVLSGQPDVTLYETALPHKDYESHVRRLILERHCRHRWSLNVDADELFDYPRSDRLPLRGLLRYLEERKATAMAGYMLDMYAKRTEFVSDAAPDLRLQYPYYDITRVARTPYHSEEFDAYCDENVLLDPNVPCQTGGIRETVFGSDRASRYLLIKHPLVFLDGIVQPVTHPHFCNGATVADVTCVLYHYKFTASFQAQVEESCRSDRYVTFAQRQYRRYQRKTRGAAALAIDTPGTRRLESVQELVDQGFLSVSPTYLAFVERGVSS